jgi:hypothetical protein
MAQDRQNVPSSGAIQLQPILSRLAQNGGIGKKARAWGS